MLVITLGLCQLSDALLHADLWLLHVDLSFRKSDLNSALLIFFLVLLSRRLFSRYLPCAITILYAGHMSTWLPIIEIADEFRLETHDVLARLEDLGFAQGAHASDLAVRHGFATLSSADGARLTLWHEDILSILEGIGMVRALPVVSEREWNHTLFDDEGTHDEGTHDSEGIENSRRIERSEGIDRSHPGSVGHISPGFDAIIATDGACSGNPGSGGWAWVEQISGVRASGAAARTTNNIMELTAMIRALEYVGPKGDLLIRCDSTYVLNTMTKWAPNWRRKGWKKADGTPVANRELVERLLDLYEGRSGRTEVEWVKGHAGDSANELCDSLAVAQSKAQG